MRINLLFWKIRSVLKNIKKGKFKALVRYFYDQSYRSDVDYMLTLVRKEPVEVVDRLISLDEIVSGHSINYPEWVFVLRQEIREYGYKSIPPIKVIYDESKKKYLIVDGNHRFAALKRELGSLQRIKVQLLTPVCAQESYERI